MNDASIPSSDDAQELLSGGGKVDRDALEALYSSIQETDPDAQPRVSFTLSRDLSKRLDRYLVDRVPFLSRTAIQRLIDENAVTVNGRRPKASTRLHKGDVVETTLPPPPSNAIPPEDIPLDVLFEDRDLIVINKQPDIIVHPARGNRSGTLINALSWHFIHRTEGGLSSVGESKCRPGVVHRLDRFTSGVMVAAKSDTAHWKLGRQFEKRKTDKRYLAIVHGEVRPFGDTIDQPLGKHPTAREKYAVRFDDLGKDSLTIYRVRERYKGYTLLELELKTGRTHQIRVHLAYLGYPIVGDDMYGGRHLRACDIDESLPSDPIIERQALHATTLAFTHPITEKPAAFTAPLRNDMRTLVDHLRAHRFIQSLAPAGSTIDMGSVLS
jgi:23S rRNA pseudouridine1911/1915/1917 synthase